MTSEKIFLLNGEWQDIKGRNELCLYGISEDNTPVEVVITNVKPVFFINRTANISDLAVEHERKNVKLKSLKNQDVDAVYFRTQRDLRKASEFLRLRNTSVFEDDIDPIKRYLMERLINAQAEITGEYFQQGNIRSYTNPTIAQCEILPKFKVLSLDIETGQDETLYSIAVHLTSDFGEVKKVFMLSDKTEVSSGHLEYFKSESKLLKSFINWINEADPDVIIGWHIIGFDLMFLEKKCDTFNIPFLISRGSQRPTFRKTKTGAFYAYVPGRAVLDGPFLMRSSFYTFEDFKLETVAQEILGTGKTIESDGNKVAEIERQFRDDKVKLAEYNLKDCELVTDIFKKTGLIDLSVTRSKLSGMLIESLGSMTAAFDHFYLPRIHRKGYVVKSLQDVIPHGHSAGGYVFEPKPGIYEDVAVCDFKSLYPSIIRTFKIDPLSRLLSNVETINTPVDIKFSKSNHILPDFITELLKQREIAKQENDKYLSQAIKILMNSFYGVMGSYGCRFYHEDLPTAITGTGQWILLTCEKYLNEKGYKVVYGDTDSLFIKMNGNNFTVPDDEGNFLADDLTKFINEKIKSDYGIESYLELEFEKHYKKFITTSSRSGSEAGAKKRYVGFIVKDELETIEFVGMEAVRSDWTKLAKEFQYELYDRVFHEKEIRKWLLNYTVNIKNGMYDDKLIYKKRLRKNIEEYTKNVPPQVKAAKLVNKSKGYVQYVITKRGPIPIELNYNDIDYQHYLLKQIKPIADSVLSLLNESFDDIVGSTQLGLFG
ncbi:MAG: DNA polymerase II [Melioribacteraceae bacterium]|nr:DNA polymerase II [Melioribacteraceae bacterium]